MGKDDGQAFGEQWYTEQANLSVTGFGCFCDQSEQIGSACIKVMEQGCALCPSVGRHKERPSTFLSLNCAQGLTDGRGRRL